MKNKVNASKQAFRSCKKGAFCSFAQTKIKRCVEAANCYCRDLVMMRN